MKVALSILSLIILFVFQKPKDNKNFSEIIFSDSLQIGHPGNNKVELIKISDGNSQFIQINFYSKKGNNWKTTYSKKFDWQEVYDQDPEIIDFNNDGFLDFTYISANAARGSNEVRKLFIYNSIKDDLQQMHNSEQFPNLMYNENLNCVTSQAYHGGSTTFFTKIEKDSLRMFASVDNSDVQVVTLYDKKGKASELSRKPLNKDEIYERYDNYNPVEVLKI